MVVKFIKANIFNVNPVINFILFEFQTKIKLKYTMTLGKHRFVVLGAMHTEKMLFDCLGDWLEGSSWTSVFTNSVVHSVALLMPLFRISHLTRTSYA